MHYTLIILLSIAGGDVYSAHYDFKTQMDCEMSKTYITVALQKDEKSLEKDGSEILKMCTKIL
ncbi:MAG: hypothetical protein KA318_00205 [Nitrosomonas sp.]|nr:hypothetical protein [Nitrosomonas sp.]